MTTPPVPGDVLDPALTPEQNPPEWTDEPGDVLDVEAVRVWLKTQLEGIYRSSGTVDGHRVAANFQRAVALCDEVDRLRAALRRVVEAEQTLPDSQHAIGCAWLWTRAECDCGTRPRTLLVDASVLADARALLDGTDG